MNGHFRPSIGPASHPLVRVAACIFLATLLSLVVGTAAIAALGRVSDPVTRGWLSTMSIAASLVIGAFILDRTYRRGGAVTVLGVVGVLVYLTLTAGLFVWITFILAWRRGLVEM